MPSVPRLGRNSYRKIADSLAAKIAAGEIAPGHFLGTERELQEAYGASRSTVRKVLSTLIEQGWAVSVPNKGVVAGRGLKPLSGTRIALVENGTYVQRVLRDRFQARLDTRGYSLNSIGGTDDYPLEYALQQVLDGDFSGALVWCFHAFPDPTLVEKLARQVPIVALDHRLGRADTDLVTFDHEAAGYEATAQLIRSGARRIGLTGMLDTLDITVARIQGYMRAMFEHDLNPNPADFVFTWTSGSIEHDTASLEMLLRSSSRPDAFLVLQDFCVPATVDAALRAGLSLPADLRLATIGDDLTLDVDGIGLTSVAFDWEVLVEQALQMLVNRINDLHQPPQTLTAPHRLIVRGSCGAPEAQWTPEPERLTGFQGVVPLPKPIHRYRLRWSVHREHLLQDIQ
jgi:DNA-binding LacI/PurR family transcriptional regulator